MGMLKSTASAQPSTGLDTKRFVSQTATFLYTIFYRKVEPVSMGPPMPIFNLLRPVSVVIGNLQFLIFDFYFIIFTYNLQ